METQTQETMRVPEIIDLPSPCQARPMISERQPKACRGFQTRQASMSNILPESIGCSNHTALLDNCCSQRSDILAFEWRYLADVDAWMIQTEHSESGDTECVHLTRLEAESKDAVTPQLETRRLGLVLQFRHAKGSEPATGGCQLVTLILSMKSEASDASFSFSFKSHGKYAIALVIGSEEVVRWWSTRLRKKL